MTFLASLLLFLQAISNLKMLVPVSSFFVIIMNSEPTYTTSKEKWHYDTNFIK